jgi:hypothetical protein
MPQIQILEGTPGFGSQLGKALGGGVGEGIQKGIAHRLSDMLKQKKELSGIGNTINQYAKRYKKGQFEPDELGRIQERTAEFIRQGASRDDAALAAFTERERGLSPWLQEGKQKTGTAALDSLKATDPTNQSQWPDIIKNNPIDPSGLQSTWEAVKGGGAQFVNAQAGTADFLNNAIQEIERAPRYAIAKLQGKSSEEFNAEEEQLEGFLKQHPSLTPTGSPGFSFQEEWQKLVGDAALPKSGADRILQAWIGGGSGAAGVTIYDEVKKGLGIETPEWMKPIEDSLVFVQAIKHGGKLNLRNLKANESLIKKAKQIGSKIKLSFEEVLQKAADESGADLKKAAQGDVKEINKLNGRMRVMGEETKGTEAARSSEKVSATPKEVFNPKEAIKQREALGEQLVESPFNEYHEIEKEKVKTEESKSAERKALDAQRQLDIQPKIDKAERQVDFYKRDIKNLERQKKNLSGSDLERVDAVISGNQRAIEKLNQELKDLRYEMKYGEKRPTEAQLHADAVKGAEKLVSQALDSSPEAQKKLMRQIELDQHFLDRADKLKERGELPGEIENDTHLRIMEKYLEVYDAKAKQLQEEINSLKGARDAESLKKISDNRKAIQHLKARQKRHRANIINQRDKIKALKATKGASGAFYKNQIRNAQKQIAEFEKDFFQPSKGEKPIEAKSEKSAKKGISEAPKVKFSLDEAQKSGEELGKDPSKENVEKVAEQTGQTKEQVGKQTENLGKVIKENKTKIDEGKATEADVKRTSRFLDSWLRRWKRDIKRFPERFAVGFGVGLITGLLEEATGWDIPAYYVSPAVGAGTRSSGGAAGSHAAHSLVNYFFTRKEAEKLKKVRPHPLEYYKEVSRLEKKYSTRRVNEIIEKSKD